MLKDFLEDSELISHSDFKKLLVHEFRSLLKTHDRIGLTLNGKLQAVVFNETAFDNIVDALLLLKELKGLIGELRKDVNGSFKDWSETKEDMFFYGTIVGWDEKSLKDLKDIFNLSSGQLKKLRRSRSVIDQLMKLNTEKEGD